MHDGINSMWRERDPVPGHPVVHFLRTRRAVAVRRRDFGNFIPSGWQAIPSVMPIV
jgi:hypothetical protein